MKKKKKKKKKKKRRRRRNERKVSKEYRKYTQNDENYVVSKIENRGRVLIICFIVHLQLAGQTKLLKMLRSVLGFHCSSKGLKFDNN